MSAKHGNLSINSDNIFPIIKKWMYSDHDIFVRELVSNGCDAITKLKKLDGMGEYTLPDDYKAAIQVIVNPDEKTLKFIDNGIGMTADEVEEYITQIAFSGATEFLEKYKDKTNSDQMIGHFGLGFYSAFMVADEVHIDSLSYKEGSTPVHWTCDGSTEYDMSEGSKTTVGTEITLFLNEDCLEFANEYRVREVLEKYCSFMPVEIFLSKANAPQEYETIDESELKDDDVVVEHIHEDAKYEEKEKEDGTKEQVEVSPAKEKVKINKRPVSISDIHPLWTKHPNECSDEDYKEFYRKVFNDYRKLYNNQVFIADNIKEVIPEYLMLLKGVIDCPDLPLNVSRSALQNDGFVKKISEYISKKFADKLSGMCKTDRENYEKYWDDINPFIKYGCIKDRKLFELLEKCGSYENLKEHLTDAIATCVDIKRRVVEEDEFDTGERILLNFGHTLAHTIEQHFHYERESHGEAVAIGMYQITKIAEEKGLTKKGEAEHIRKVLEAYKLPVKADVPLPQLTEAIKLDKKTLNNKLKVVLLHEIGDSYTYPTGQEFFDGDRMV